MQAQSSISGEYYLRGVMETASGFKLNDDSTFQFFFSYGALDRYGQGTWAVHDGKIIFNSKPYPGKDFKLVSSAADKNDFTTVIIQSPNKMIFNYVHCLVFTNGQAEIYDADSDGIIQLPGRNADSIHIVSELSSERMSDFAIDNTAHNVFTFSIEQWIAEVFFNNFSLAIHENELTGKHPLLKDGEYVYEKN
ncbi:MAG TPA: hypothetical protein PL045_10535 [Chitinophagaceae bacterium]|nr:hypothetical protein [Chitinophagaceae bacterium]